jgi:hypothetical protein
VTEPAGEFWAEGPTGKRIKVSAEEAAKLMAAGAKVDDNRSQLFFAQLARDIRAPHTGDAHRNTVNGILRQAEQAGLFTPEES